MAMKTCVEWASDHSRRLHKNDFYIFFPSDLDRWPLDIKFIPLTAVVRRYVSAKLEVSTAFLLRENQRHDDQPMSFWTHKYVIPCQTFEINIKLVINNVCVALTGDQLGGLGKHYVLRTGRTFLLGLDLFRCSHHCKSLCNMSFLFAPLSAQPLQALSDR